MIKSLSVTNYQSHKASDLKFANNVNVIIGKSDAGKTTVLRAIDFVINNRPSGDAFRSNWGGDTLVDMQIENETISREKGKENLYVISTNIGKHPPQEYRAFGQGVPEEIKTLLNMSEINIQRQMDSPFLLSSDTSPGEVARYLNKIVRLDKIDSSLANIARTMKQETNNLKHGTNHLTELREEIKKYDWLPMADGELTALECLDGKTNKLKKDIRNLKHIISDITEVETNRKQFEGLLPAEKSLQELNALNAGIAKIRVEREKLRALYKEIEKVDSRLCLVRILAGFGPDLDLLLALQKDIEAQQIKYNILAELLDEIEKMQSDKKQAISTRDRLQKEFDLAMPSVCPLCEQEIRKN